MDSPFALGHHFLATGQVAAARDAFHAIIPRTSREALYRQRFLGLCLRALGDDDAAFRAFEAGRVIALALADVGEIIALDVLAARTLIALTYYELLTDRLTTDLTQRLPFVAEDQLRFLTRELYFWLCENAVAQGDREAAATYRAIALALLERDLPPDMRALLDQIITSITDMER